MSNHTVHIRTATADDDDVVSELLTELGYATNPVEVPARLAAVLAEGGVVVLAIGAAGEPLGLMCLTKHAVLHAPRRVAYIIALITTSTARRRGVGRRLVTAAKEWAQQEGCVRLSVTSAEHRTDAHAFYPACGLPYTGRRFAIPISPTI